MPWLSGPNSPLGYPVPGFVETSELVPNGTVAKFFDPVQGEGEFIFLPGAASMVLGNAVHYTLTPGAEAVVRHTNALASNTGRPIAFATAAIVAGTWGWFQIAGLAIATVAAGFVNNGVLFGTATAGVLDDAADAGDQILNALGASAVGTPAANQAYVTCRYPFVQGQIT